MTNNKSGLLNICFNSLLLIFSSFPLHAAEGLTPRLVFMSKLSDSSISYGTALPVIATDTKNRFLLIGNFEDFLQERKTKNSKIIHPGFAKNKMAIEAANAASQMAGVVSYLLDGKDKTLQIDSYAYDSKLDISVLNVIPDESTFVKPKIANADSKPYLDCSKVKKRMIPGRRSDEMTDELISLNSIKNDVILEGIALPQIKGKLDSELLHNPYECVITDSEGILLGINRSNSITDSAKSNRNVTLIYQPLDSIFPFAQELAATGKVASDRAAITSAVREEEKSIIGDTYGFKQHPKPNHAVAE